MKKVFTTLALLTLLHANSQEKSLSNTEYQLNSTSDQITVHTFTLDYDSNRRDILWPYKNESQSAFDFSFSFTRTMGSIINQKYRGNRVLGSVGYKRSEHLYFEIATGINNLEDKTTTIPLYFKNVHRFKYFFGEIHLFRDLLYHSLSMPGSVTQEMNTQTIKLKETITPTSYMKIPFTISTSKFSDQNRQNQYSLDLLFGNSYPLWIWVGIGYFKNSNQSPSLSYWSPKKIQGLGLRTDLSYSFKEIYHAGFLLNLNRSQEDQSEWFYGSYSSLFFKYGKRNHWQIAIQWNHIASRRSSSSWYQNDFLMRATLSL